MVIHDCNVKLSAGNPREAAAVSALRPGALEAAV